MAKDKAVLITGAGSGIGEACAHAFAAAGARLALADIDKAAAERVAAACGGVGAVIEADCGDVASIEAMVEAAANADRASAPGKGGRVRPRRHACRRWGRSRLRGR